jgi:polysaccharide export outer membrane protein
MAALTKHTRNLVSIFLAVMTAAPFLDAQDGAFPRVGSGASREDIVSAGQIYLLRPSDLIYFAVFNEPDLTKEVRVEANGEIRLHLIGSVEVAGLSLEDAQEKVRRLYDRDYLVNPQISMQVLEYAPRRVQVLGEVNRPGFVPIPPDRGLTLIEAITGANGFRPAANKRKVSLKRELPNGTSEVIEVNVDRLMQDRESKDIPLRDGDTIFVRESILG